jgi:hypothetical protein
MAMGMNFIIIIFQKPSILVEKVAIIILHSICLDKIDVIKISCILFNCLTSHAKAYPLAPFLPFFYRLLFNIWSLVARLVRTWKFRLNSPFLANGWEGLQNGPLFEFKF